MKALFLITTFLLTVASVGQENLPGRKTTKIELANTHWKTNIHCFTSPDEAFYELYEVNELEQFHWGNHISFTQDTFTTSYSAPCGVDCFTTVTGTYKYISTDRIEVYVESIVRSGFCQEESETPKKVFGTYKLVQTAVGVTMTKLTDQK